MRATNANEDFERGNLNRALQAIRSAARNEGLVDDEAVAAEIPLRANAYRQRFAHCALTPTALAKHWCRVMITPLAGNTTQDDAVARARLIR